MSKKMPKPPPGTWIERDMFESPAYLALRGLAPQLLILILGKRHIVSAGRKGKQKRICTNHDTLSFTYIEAEKKYGITKARLARAIDDLLAKGFLTIKHQGGAYRQDKTIYALSNKWTLWSPRTVFEERKLDPVQRGFCKPRKK